MRSELRKDPVPGVEGVDFEWLTPFDPAKLAKRPWVLGHHLIQGYLTDLTGPPGVGKTALQISMAIALASGRGKIVGMTVPQRCRVLISSRMHSLADLKRYLALTMEAFKLTPADIAIDDKPGVLLHSLLDDPLALVHRNNLNQLVITQEGEALATNLPASGIGVVLFDSFSDLHPCYGDNLADIRLTCRIMRSLARRSRCAFLMTHRVHGFPGEAGSADTLSSVTRVSTTLYPLSAQLADRFGVPEDERHRYAIFEDAKNCLALSGKSPRFFRRETVAEAFGILRPVTLKHRDLVA